MSKWMPLIGVLLTWPLRAVGCVLGYAGHAFTTGILDGLDAAEKWRRR